MTEFEANLNDLLVNTFNNILKYEEISLKTIAPEPITGSEAHVLEAIECCAESGETATISAVASRLNVAVATTTVAIKKLERRAYVTKVQCELDGRRTIVRLTESGQRIHRAHTLFHRRMVRDISRTLTDTEREVLLTTVNKLSNLFKDKVEKK